MTLRSFLISLLSCSILLACAESPRIRYPVVKGEQPTELLPADVPVVITDICPEADKKLEFSGLNSYTKKRNVQIVKKWICNGFPLSVSLDNKNVAQMLPEKIPLEIFDKILADGVMDTTLHDKLFSAMPRPSRYLILLKLDGDAATMPYFSQSFYSMSAMLYDDQTKRIAFSYQDIGSPSVNNQEGNLAVIVHLVKKAVRATIGETPLPAQQKTPIN